MNNRLRLRKVEVVDFRRSEATNFEEFRSKNKQLVESFGVDDVVLFINHQSNQLVFVYGFRDLSEEIDGVAVSRQLLVSRRLRLTNGAWSPALLVDYARQAGIELAGLKSFGERLKEHLIEVREHRRELAKAAA